MIDMSFSPTLSHTDDNASSGVTSAAADRLLVWEWLFLHFVLAVASYALALQPQLSSLAWYLIYLLSLGLFLLRYGAFLGSLWIAVPLLLWAALAGLSYFWSDVPGQTLRSSVQLGMTVCISAYLGSRFSLFDLTRALFVVLALTALLSLALILMKFPVAYDHNGVARGLFPHKNVLGGNMVLLLICCLLLLASGWRRLTVVATAVLGLTLIVYSQSSTAIVMMLGLCAVAPVLLTRGAPALLRLIGYIVGLLVATLAIWFLFSYDLDPAGLALEALGKERTLTGRSVLWEIAVGLIEQRPWLGNGLDAFWNGGDGSAGRYVQRVIEHKVMNFHNSYLDIAVQLGFVGLALTVGFLLLFAWRAVALLQTDGSPLATLPAFFLAFVVCYSLSEYALFRQHSLIQVLLGALYVSTALALPAPRPGPSRRQASTASWPAT
ncbi:MAG: O-antigen ligase family protein [Kiloniellaceae bacterium]